MTIRDQGVHYRIADALLREIDNDPYSSSGEIERLLRALTHAMLASTTDEVARRDLARGRRRMTQFRITGIDTEATALVIACPHCKAEPGVPCDFRGPSTRHRHNPRTHLARHDRANRQRMKDLYGCSRCAYACDCLPGAARWLPSSTVTIR